MRKDLFDRGKTEFNAGRYEKAARLFLAAIKEDKETQAWKSLGVTQPKSEDHQAWYALSLCFLRLGQNKKAIQCLKNALQLDPHNKQYQHSLNKLTKKTLLKRSTKFLEKICIFLKDAIWYPFSKVTRYKRPRISRFHLKRTRNGTASGTGSATSAGSSRMTSDMSENKGKNRDPKDMIEFIARQKMVKEFREQKAADAARNAEDEEIEELLALDII